MNSKYYNYILFYEFYNYIMAKSLIRVKYVWEQKYTRMGMNHRIGPNLTDIIVNSRIPC